MEARYAIRQYPWLAACQGAPEIFDQVMPRLSTLREPLVETFQGQALTQHAKTSGSGLLSDVGRKNVASIASPGGQNRLGLQRFMGWAAWDDAPWRQTWLDPVGQQGGQSDGVLGFAPAACPPSGRASVGVARQGCGRVGQVDHGHVAISLGDVSAHGHTLVAMRLSLPTAWPQEKARRHKGGGPKAHRGSRTRHPLAWERLEQHGPVLPQAWMAGDEERGRPYWVRRRRVGLGERSRLAVPAHTLLRELETAPPGASGRGRQPPRPWPSVEQGSQALSAEAWKRIDVREGAKGPLLVEVGKRRVGSRTPRR